MANRATNDDVQIVRDKRHTRCDTVEHLRIAAHRQRRETWEREGKKWKEVRAAEEPRGGCVLQYATTVVLLLHHTPTASLQNPAEIGILVSDHTDDTPVRVFLRFLWRRMLF